VERLCEEAGLRFGSDRPAGGAAPDNRPVAALKLGPVDLLLGDPGTDLATGLPVRWVMNASGRSPHIAAMGTLGTGKTRIAIALLKQMREQSGCAVIVFDFKGDLAENKELATSLGAEVVSIPRQTLPLDVLSVPAGDSFAIDVAAQRFRESFARVCVSRPGGVQQDALREAAKNALVRGGKVRLEDVRDALLAYYEESDRKADSVTATFNDLCAFTLFAPDIPAIEFFQRSWIIDLHDAPETAQRLVAFLLFDAMDAWLKHEKDAPLDSENHRQLRVVLTIDEARRVLGYGQPSLIEIVRMSRSKGGAVVLISQSPDDFAQEDEDFLANIGLLFSFRTNAKAGSLQRVFGERVDLAALSDGVCVTRLPGRDRKRPIRIQAWSSNPA
jgi:hypothetical protein